MSQSWKWKIYLVLFTAILSIYVLVPTFLGFNSLREEAEKKGNSLPWYVKLFPEKELNLGLDLRGGIYLELEVSVEEAIYNRLDLMASEISRFLKGKNEKLSFTIDRIPKTYYLRAVAPDAATLQTILDYARSNYRGVLVEKKEAVEKVFQSSDTEEAKLQSTYQSLVEELSKKEGIVDIERSQNSNLFRVVVKEGADFSSEVQSILSSKFSSLKEINEPNKVVFQIVSTYLDKMRSDTVKQAVETIRNRIDRYGVSEPSIRQLGSNRIAIELPGVTNPDRAISIVKKAGKLEFKIVDDSKNESELRALVAQTRKENSIPEGFTEEIVNRLNDLLKGKIPAEDEIAFELEYDPISKKTVRGVPYLLNRKAEVTGEMLRSTQVSVNNNEPYVTLSFNPLGTKIFGEVTEKNIGKRFAILLDGTVTKAPVIKSAIPSGEAQITLGYGSYDTLIKEAEDLVLVLREGALPATLKEITKTVIGPSLGKLAIRESLIASLIAGAALFIFMIVYYKTAGFIADIVLALNVVLIAGLLAMFQATLTLPGIAGIVLTMGMALDANILIFERIREELKNGKSPKVAIETGFSNSFTAVVDTHLTTFLSGMVLYHFGTGPIRGFAVTLIIGVITTLFTAYWVMKLVYSYLLLKVKIQKVSI